MGMFAFNLRRSEAEKQQDNQPITNEPLVCSGQTRTGKPCKNKAETGSQYCKVHQKG